MTPRRLIAVLAIAFISGACGSGADDSGAGAAGKSSSGESASPAHEAPGERLPLDVQAADLVVVESFKELAAASDAVVVARVEDVVKGRTVGGEEGSEQALTFNRVELTVVKLLRGDLKGQATIFVEEDGWSGELEVATVNGVERSSIGDVGVFFLHLKADRPAAGAYRLVNYQSRFVAGERPVEGSLMPDIASLTPEQVEERASAALKGA